MLWGIFLTPVIMRLLRSLLMSLDNMATSTCIALDQKLKCGKFILYAIILLLSGLFTLSVYSMTTTYFCKQNILRVVMKTDCRFAPDHPMILTTWPRIAIVVQPTSCNKRNIMPFPMLTLYVALKCLQIKIIFSAFVLFGIMEHNW